jgi:rhamnosyl/mannosyltransferase
MHYRVLHTYKSFKPEETGGIAEAISMAATAKPFEHRILVTRRSPGPNTYVFEGTMVRAVPAWFTASSMPIAPAYSAVLSRMARDVHLLVHHAPFPLTDAAIFLAGRRLRTPFIVHWHADLIRSPWIVKAIAPLLTRTLEQARRIIVPHRSVLENTPILRSHEAKCVVRPYAVDVNYWGQMSDGEKRRSEAIRARSPRLIVAVGRLVSYKGYDILLRSMQNVDAQLTIVGTGPLRTGLDRLATELGVKRKVTLAGYMSRDDLKTVLHSARIFVFPSTSTAESFGIVQLEAMAAGLPVVNTSLSSAVPHVARDGLEGITVSPADVRALADAINCLLDDPAKAAKLGSAAQRRAMAEFDQSGFRSAVERIYLEAIDGSRR